jgi:hypothetical protein
MDPNNIELENLNKLFEYEKHSRLIDECNDLNSLKRIAKSYVKLYLKQQETLIHMGKV